MGMKVIGNTVWMQHQILRANNKEDKRNHLGILTIQLTPFRSGIRILTTFSWEDIMCSRPADITAKALSRTYKKKSDHESFTMQIKQLSDSLQSNKACPFKVLANPPGLSVCGSFSHSPFKH